MSFMEHPTVRNMYNFDSTGYTAIYVIDLVTGKYDYMETIPFFCFHHVNAFEDENGNINVDLIYHNLMGNGS